MDALRGVAALAVCIGHLRSLFFLDLRQLPGRAVVIEFVYFCSGFGHQAVMVFFVLSGFLIGSSVIRSVQTNRWSWKTYLLNRFTRLYVVLIPALLLGLLWDHFGMLIFGGGGIYDGGSNVLNFAVAGRLGIAALLGNALFLQDILVKTFGSNGPLWSLSYEFWYYLIFPLFLLALVLNRGQRKRWLLAIGGFAALVFVGKDIALYFIIWLLGVAVSLLPDLRLSARCFLVRVTTAAALGFFVLVLAMTRAGAMHPTFLSDLTVGFACAVTLYAWLISRKVANASAYTGAARLSAKSSYTLYLVHLPLLVFIRAWLIPGRNRWIPDGRHAVVAALILGIVLGYTYLIAQATEARTEAIRRLLLRKRPEPTALSIETQLADAGSLVACRPVGDCR